MAYCLVIVDTVSGHPLLVRSTGILERNDNCPEMILNLLDRPSDNQIPLALIGILTSSYTFSSKFGIQLRSCQSEDCTIHFHEYNNHLLMCLLVPTEYDIPEKCIQYKLLLLRTMLNMIIGYEYIDQISQMNAQRLESELDLVKFFVDTILNDENAFSFGDLTQCADTVSGCDRNTMYSCMKSICEQVQSEHACITLSNRILVSSTAWSCLSAPEQYILTLIIGVNDPTNDILPNIRDMPIYLHSIDTLHNYRLLSVRLLGEIFVSIICSATPRMNDFDSVVDRICRPHTEYIHNLNSVLYPRSLHDNIVLDPNVQALLYINRQTRFCVSTLDPIRSSNPMGLAEKKHRYKLLKNFFMEIVRMNEEKLLPFYETNSETRMNEMYMLNHDNDHPHKCYYLTEQHIFELYIVFDTKIPTIAMRGITRKMLSLLKKHL